MALEIERKFTVRDLAVVKAHPSVRVTQGYLSRGGATCRVRVSDFEAWLTIKGRPSEDGRVRSEFEYPIPLCDVFEMLSMCEGRTLSKTRYFVPVEGVTWEVDVYDGALAGLATAEVELKHPDDPLVVPEWVGKEVTGDPAWSNEALATRGKPA